MRTIRWATAVICGLALSAGCDKSKKSEDPEAGTPVEKTPVEAPASQPAAPRVTSNGASTTVTTPDGRVTVDTKKGITRFTGADGTTVVQNETKAPEGFPLPIPKGATFDSTTHQKKPDGGEVFLVTVKTAENFDDLVALYEKALSEKGLTPERTDLNQSQQRHTLVSAQNDTLEVVVQILHKEGDADTTAVLSWSRIAAKR